MKHKLPALPAEQWDFLSVLHAFEMPVPIDIAGTLAPILPGLFLDLMGRDNKPRYIYKAENEYYALVPDLSPKVLAHLKAVNSPKRISALIDRLYDEKLIDQIKPENIARLIAKSGPKGEKVKIEMNLAQKALAKREWFTAFKFLKSVVNRLHPVSEDPNDRRLFVSAVIELSDVWFVFGKNFFELILYLKGALEISRSMGDKRSHAILNLNSSLYLHLAGEHSKAWDAFSAGYKEVEELGDEDIRNRTAPVLGRSFYYQGLWKDAVRNFERIYQINRFREEIILTPDFLSDPMAYGYFLSYLGHFHEAVGSLYFSLQMAKERGEKLLTTVSKTCLAYVLLMIRKNRPAGELLESAYKEAKTANNTLYLYMTQRNLAFMHFLEGDMDRARKMLAKAIVFGEKRGVRYILSPHILEMLFEFERLGYPPHPKINYKDEIKKVLKGINIHLKGVGLRLEAISAGMKNEPLARIENHLIESEKYLKQAGDNIQLAKTRLERARLKLSTGDRAEALNVIDKAYDAFGNYAPVFFPEDLRHLRETDGTGIGSKEPSNNIYLKILEAYDSIASSENIADIQYKLLKNICRIVMAERAALFRFDKDGSPETPCETILYNITRDEAASSRFEAAIILAMQARKTKKACIKRYDAISILKNNYPIRAMYCLPVIDDDEVSWVLYLDNIFLEDCYDAVDAFMITKLVHQTDRHVERMQKYEKFKDERDLLVSGRPFQNEQIQNQEIRFQNPVMAQVMSQADKAAPTDSAVLIHGETGTGKDLLAKRIHDLSSRKNGPFVVVDLTAIPENLLESELFGYEKGAFTGAERRKKGRLELAHQGTLFLDEIGEIPLFFQVKILRVLQEKKFVRVGGTRTRGSDFRLIAATNRNLEEEVLSGRFRQDLFYRLNVMPIVLPPLRERGNDILLLARYFMERYAKKYNRLDIYLSPQDEAWMMTYSWPGNVRELENVMERAVILSADGELKFRAANTLAVPTEQTRLTDTNPKKVVETAYIPIDDFPSLEEVQRRYIKKVLEKTNGKMGGPGGATEILKMKPSTLYSRMNKLGLRPK